MFSQWRAPSTPEEIPALVQKLADGFPEFASKASSQVTVAGDKNRVEQFAGQHCQGSYVIFQISKDGTQSLHTIFMMSVDGVVWNGQFIGPQEAWEQALAVLKSVRKNG